MAVESPPIIIKKIKKGGHGHHGGAWKVAFADFVTAMMAFFMLMWLLGSTTPEQKAAISEYMNDPTASAGPGGAGKNPIFDGGAGINEGKGPSSMPQNDPGESNMESAPSEATSDYHPPMDEAEQMAQEAEKRRLESMLEELKATVEAQALKPFKDQLLLDITSEGLRIQIVDKENRPMFAQGSPVLESYTREILRAIVGVIKSQPNHISISGHTDKTPYSRQNGYSNWELSADRANAARRELVAAGLEEDRIGRVVGLSSSVLFDKQNPFSPVNRRISIIVMTKAAGEAVSSGEGPSAIDAPAGEIPDAGLPPPAEKAGLEDAAVPAETPGKRG